MKHTNKIFNIYQHGPPLCFKLCSFCYIFQLQSQRQDGAV